MGNYADAERQFRYLFGKRGYDVVECELTRDRGRFVYVPKGLDGPRQVLEGPAYEVFFKLKSLPLPKLQQAPLAIDPRRVVHEHDPRRQGPR